MGAIEKWKAARIGNNLVSLDDVLRVLDQTLFRPTTAISILLYSFYRARQVYGPIHTLQDHVLVHKWLRRLVMVSLLSRLNRLLNRLATNGGFSRDVPRFSKAVKQGDAVLVTGGAAGIGHEVVKLLAKKTVNIAVLDLAEPKSPVAGVKYFRCDVTSEEDVANVARQVLEQVGEPTIIFNNAGILRGGSLLDNTTSSMMLTFKVNVVGVQNILKHFLPHLIKINSGHHILFASAAAYISVANLGEYTISKAGSLALHETLREELKYRYNAPNVRTSVITPTKVSTPLGAALNELDDQFVSPTIRPEWIAAKVVEVIESGLSSHVSAPAAAGVILPLLRVVPDWIRWILAKIGKYDKVVTAQSLQAHRNVYSTVSNLEKSTK
ncbi:hypothetical protein OIV83_002068 [Microbotryomycetes sp. JL201]|nr:hypothetical protein OIV83_002068 [Microbotryomycetes sp. JL201]